MTRNNYSILTLPLISLIFGIYFQQVFTFTNTTLTYTNVVLVFLLCILFNKKIPLKSIYIFCTFLFFFSGALLLQNKKNIYSNLLEKIENQKLNIIAKIENKETNQQNKEVLKLFVIKTKNENQTNYIQANFKLLCYIQKPTKLQIQDKIEINNIYINKSINQKYFCPKPTFQDYLLKEGILTTIFIPILNYKIISSPTFSLKRFIFNWKNLLYKKLKQKIPPTIFDFFATIFLGNKTNIQTTKLKKNFNLWGISHQLARSGLHIVIFILIWNFFLSLLPIPIFFKKIILLIITLIYALFSWSSISFIRAFYVFLFYEVGRLLNQNTNFLHLLSLVCFLILLINPIQLFFLDFQLSFSLTFVLAWFAKNATPLRQKNSKLL